MKFINHLVKEMISPLLEESNEIVAIYGGGFKPPTLGHFEVVKQALEANPEIDKFQVVVGSGNRDGLTQADAVWVWEQYEDILPLKVEIIAASKPPIAHVYNYAKENPNKTIYWVIGTRKGNDEDYNDISTRTSYLDKNKDKYNNVEVKIIETDITHVSGTKARAALKSGDRELFFSMLPPTSNKEEIFNHLAPTQALNELNNHEIKIWATQSDILSQLMKHPETYDKMKSEMTGDRLKALEYFWDFLESGTLKENIFDKPSLKSLNENASYSKDIDIEGKIIQLTQHMLDKGYNIEPLPAVEFVDGDSENAKNFFGKTAYYDPNTQTIVLYTEGRHPKDIVRSFAHEMIHHIQNLEGRLGDIQTTNTQEDDNLNDIEAEANLKGTMTFRNWTDSLNEAIVGEKIECDNCGWSWNIVDGGDDLFICHKCGHDNEDIEYLNEKYK